MLTVTIEEQNVKSFMNTLFKNSAFDDFEVRELTVNAFCELKIIGTLSKTFLSQASEGDKRQYALWSEIKPFAVSFIKGGVRPESIKIVFSGGKTLLGGVHPNAKAVFMNMFYDANTVRFTAGTSQKEFSLNKELDISWEGYVLAFFKKLGVPYK